jgi:hypothetical protein
MSVKSIIKSNWRMAAGAACLAFLMGLHRGTFDYLPECPKTPFGALMKGIVEGDAQTGKSLHCFMKPNP